MKQNNHGFVFIVVLALCLLIDVATSDTLSFIDMIQSAVQIVRPVMWFEDIICFISAVCLVLAIVAFITQPRRVFNRIMAAALLFSTFGLFLNVAGLLRTLFFSHVNPEIMLLAAVAVYLSNILVFVVWYWFLDYPSQEDRAEGKPAAPVLVFPQNAAEYAGYENWMPGLVDYLFLSFHTSSAVGPTDTLVLSRDAKIAMMCQVAVSLIVLIMLAARAIGVIR